MRIFYTIIPFFMLAMILMSCDSITIDSNTLKIPDDNRVGSGNNILNLAKPNAIFTQTSQKGSSENRHSEVISHVFTYSNCSIDTSSATPSLCISMGVNFDSDPNTKIRNFQLKLDNVVFSTDSTSSFSLDGDTTSSHWISITMIDDITGNLSHYSGTQLIAEIKLIKYDLIKNIIVCELTVKFPDGNNSYLVLFQGEITYELNKTVEKPVTFKSIDF